MWRVTNIKYHLWFKLSLRDYLKKLTELLKAKCFKTFLCLFLEVFTMLNKYNFEEPCLALPYGSLSCADLFLFLQLDLVLIQKLYKICKSHLPLLQTERENLQGLPWGLPGCDWHGGWQMCPADSRCAALCPAESKWACTPCFALNWCQGPKVKQNIELRASAFVLQHHKMSHGT